MTRTRSQTISIGCVEINSARRTVSRVLSGLQRGLRPAGLPPSNLTLCDHPSGITVARDLERPTRELTRAFVLALPYLALHRAGFSLPPTLPPTRCALTAPVRPYLMKHTTKCAFTGGILSVALSVGSPRPAVSRRSCPLVLGLSSTKTSETVLAAIARPPRTDLRVTSSPTEVFAKPHHRQAKSFRVQPRNLKPPSIPPWASRGRVM